MKPGDVLGLLVSMLVFVFAVHAALRTPRWWSHRGPAPEVESIPRLLVATDDESFRTAEWTAVNPPRELFGKPRPLPTTRPGATGVAAAETGKGHGAAAEPPVEWPRFELIGCAETARGMGALVLDRLRGETALLCPGDVESRWQARLVALERDSPLDPARIEFRELPEGIPGVNHPQASPDRLPPQPGRGTERGDRAGKDAL